MIGFRQFASWAKKLVQICHGAALCHKNHPAGPAMPPMITGPVDGEQGLPVLPVLTCCVRLMGGKIFATRSHVHPGQANQCPQTD
jgi:hypothetical protein